MKYKIGERVVFIKKSNKENAWDLNNYEIYTISDYAYNNISNNDYVVNKNYYGVWDKDGSESTWYDEIDFIGLKEYRKIKLEKINNESIS